MKKNQNEISKKQRRDSVTVSNTIARKIDTQKNKTRTGHLRDRYERAKIVTTERMTRTGHQQDRDKRATAVTTACNGTAC